MNDKQAKALDAFSHLMGKAVSELLIAVEIYQEHNTVGDKFGSTHEAIHWLLKSPRFQQTVDYAVEQYDRLKAAGYK